MSKLTEKAIIYINDLVDHEDNNNRIKALCTGVNMYDEIDIIVEVSKKIPMEIAYKWRDRLLIEFNAKRVNIIWR